MVGTTDILLVSPQPLGSFGVPILCLKPFSAHQILLGGLSQQDRGGMFLDNSHWGFIDKHHTSLFLGGPTVGCVHLQGAATVAYSDSLVNNTPPASHLQLLPSPLNPASWIKNQPHVSALAFRGA